LDETLPLFAFDFERISQVIENFISNACIVISIENFTRDPV